MSQQQQQQQQNKSRRATVELEELRNRLREAEETLAAIRNGEVDSLIVTGPHGDQVFSLRGAEQPYRVFVEQMQEGAVTLMPDGTILYANRRFAWMVKTPLEKVIGAGIQAFVLESDRAALAEALADPEGKKLRLTLAGGDGAGRIAALLTFSRLPMEDMEAVCLVVTDLTEEEEKRELSAALADLRAAQAQLRDRNRALELARGAADAANQAKDEFLAALSHELRTPLTPVLLTVAMLEVDEGLPASVRDEMQMVRRNVELEARLIDDLLDLTRIARGKIELKPELVDVHATVGSALEVCRADLAAKGLRLVEEREGERFLVAGDPVRIHQILWNLARNAVKFTPSGGQIGIRTTGGPDEVVVTVSDNGIGIDAEAMDRIFEPFEQADRLVTRQFGGLGLGLAISRRLAELHGGTITAESGGRNRGATFTLRLPSAAATAATAATEPSAGSPSGEGATAPRASRRLRILLVEDHEDTRRSMSRLLARTHTVREVSTMTAAIQAAAGEPFDLVISDLGLPDGSGLELMRTLRRQYGVKGICLSGYGMEEDVARSVEAGFCEHLTKPINMMKLERAIDSAMG